MNLLELKLLAYKKRDYMFTFLKFNPLDTTIRLDKDEVTVNLFDDEKLVLVSTNSTNTLNAAIEATVGVRGKVAIDLAAPYTLNNALEVQLIAPDLSKIIAKYQSLLVPAISAELTIRVNKIFGGQIADKLAATINTWLSAAAVVKLDTYMNPVVFDSIGVLDKAKVARLADYNQVTLGQMIDDYTSWFEAATLARFHFSMY